MAISLNGEERNSKGVNLPFLLSFYCASDGIGALRFCKSNGRDRINV